MFKSFNFSSTVCPQNNLGPNCAKCPQKCESCDSSTGKCTQCQGSLFGEYCQYNCSVNCYDLICDQISGICNSCVEGYKGKNCEQSIATSISRTDIGKYKP